METLLSAFIEGILVYILGRMGTLFLYSARYIAGVEGDGQTTAQAHPVGIYLWGAGIVLWSGIMVGLGHTALAWKGTLWVWGLVVLGYGFDDWWKTRKKP